MNSNLISSALTFYLLGSMGALGFVDRAIYGQWEGKGGDIVTVTINLSTIAISVFLYWSGYKVSRTVLFNRLLPFGAAALLLVTIAWSVDPRVTFTQGIAYFFVVLGAVGIAESLDFDTVMRSTALASAFCAIASLLQYFAFPEPGDFRGVFPQKNLLGEAMAVGVLGALHVMRRKKAFNIRYACVAGLCTCVAYMSKSATSLLAIAAFVYLDMLGRSYLKGGASRTRSVFILLVSVPVGSLFILYSDTIFEMLGKDPSLSGRTLIWPYVVDQIIQRPLFGWGFCAFWSTANPLAYQISRAIAGPDNWWVFVVPEAHNGVLEILLEIGFLGTFYFLFLLGRTFAMAIRCMNGPAIHIGLTTALLLVGIFITAVSEEVLLAAQQPWTALLFVTALICEKQLRLARTARGRNAAGIVGQQGPLVGARLRLREKHSI